MSLRPTEIQIILSATRDIEKIQHLAQQQTRSQQEQMAVQFQHEMEERKKQAQALAKAEQGQINNIDKNPQEKKQRHGRRRTQDILDKEEKDPRDTTDGEDPHIIDMLV